MMNVIINEGWADQRFIADRCENYDALWEVVKTYTPDVVSAITGVPEEQIRAAAELYARTPKAGIFYTLGITEHTTGTANVMNLANLAMVTGHVGVPHAGVNPLRGQNNVQGACDMGALPNVYSGYRNVTMPETRGHLRGRLGRAARTATWACASPRCSTRPTPANSRPCTSWARTRSSPTPTPTTCAGAIESLEFLVVQDIFMTETAKYADVILPAACYAEKDGTFTNTERRVPAGAQGGGGSRRGPARLGDHPAICPPAWATRWITTRQRDIFDETAEAHPHVRRHDLRARGHLRSPVALSDRGPPRDGVLASRHVPPWPRAHDAGGVRGAGRAHERGVPDPAHHGAQA